MFPAAVLSTGMVVTGLVVEAPITLERVLSSRAAVWIGRRSYGLYLWHYLIYAGIPWRTGLPRPILQAEMVAVPWLSPACLIGSLSCRLCVSSVFSGSELAEPPAALVEA